MSCGWANECTRRHELLEVTCDPRQSRDSGILCPGPEFFFENSLCRCSLQKGFRAWERAPSGSTLSCPVQTAAPAQRPTQGGCACSPRATHKALWLVLVGTWHSPSPGQVATGRWVEAQVKAWSHPSGQGRAWVPARSWDIGTAGRGCCTKQEGWCSLEFRPYRPLSERKGRSERQVEPHLLSRETTQEAPPAGSPRY